MYKLDNTLDFLKLPPPPARPGSTGIDIIYPQSPYLKGDRFSDPSILVCWIFRTLPETNI